jgi:hypothetical protein
MEQEKIGLETSSNLLFDIVVGQVENNKVLREAGKHICIPSPFPRFGEEYPAGNILYCVGKSKIWQNSSC